MSKIHPKVYVPMAVNLLVGFALVALDERELGLGILLAAVNGAGLGYVANVRGTEITGTIEETEETEPEDE